MSRFIGAGIRAIWVAGSLLFLVGSAGLASAPAAAAGQAETGGTPAAQPIATPTARQDTAAASDPATGNSTANNSDPAAATSNAAADPVAPASKSAAAATHPAAAASHPAVATSDTTPGTASSSARSLEPLLAQADTSGASGQQVAQAGPSQPAAQAGAAPQASQLQQVVVTGSHITESTFTSPTPITVIDSNTIQSLGLVDVGDVLNEIPANSNFTSAANVGLGNFYLGAQFANLRGLDPFFGTRTLTLVNSERFVPTAAGGQVDLNVIPSIMIDHTDVVTGGASAAYGSDAVAGVVNVVLDNKFQGFKAQVDGGETTYSDGGDMHVAAEWGQGFANDRVHEVVGAEYEDAQGIGTCGEVRPWCAQGWSEFTNTGYLTNGLPHYIIGPNGTSYFPYSGMLESVGAFNLPGAILGEFNNAGTALVPFNPGTYGSGAGAFTATQAGSGPNYYDGVTIRPPVTHWSVYSHTGFDLTDTLQASLDISVAERRADNQQAGDGAYGFPANVIEPYNAYLPASVSAAMDGSPAYLYSNVGDQLQLINNTTNYVGRGVLGLKGDIAGSWTWNGYYEYGENGTRERLDNDIVEYFGSSPLLPGNAPLPANTYDFFNWALDAVNNGSGQIVCAATLPTIGGVANPVYSPLAAGCQPLNLFGTANANAAALAYAYRTLHQDSAFVQQVVSTSAQGHLFSGWGAGPIAAAIGAEFRHNMASVTHDMADQPWYDQYFLSYGNDYSGDTDDVEGFGELDVPILKNVPLADNLELNIAARETQFKDSNTLTGLAQTYDFPSWKLGLVWDPVDWLRVRAARSRDTRAPSFYELWAQTVDTGGLFGTVANPWVNGPGTPLFGVPVDVARVASGGNSPVVGLRPEEADTTTLGIVLTPAGALGGLNLSADWYQIIISDAISEVGAAGLVTACYDGYTYYCQFINGTPNDTGGFSSITGVNNYNLNIGSYTVRGFDYEVDYKLPLSRFASGRADSLDFRVLATYQYDQIINPGAGLPVYNYAGQTGPTAAFGDFNTVPKWQGNGFITYNDGPLTGVLQIHYIGSGKFEAVDPNTGLPVLAPGDPGYTTAYGASINNNSVASATYFNLALTYTLPFWQGSGQQVQVFGTLDNIFNRYPPVAPGGNGYPTNPVYFDTYGRTWRLGLRLQL